MESLIRVTCTSVITAVHHGNEDLICFKGRRDIGSALRRKLHKRLFKKKRKRDKDELPEVRVRNAWGETTQNMVCAFMCVSKSVIDYGCSPFL